MDKLVDLKKELIPGTTWSHEGETIPNDAELVLKIARMVSTVLKSEDSNFQIAVFQAMLEHTFFKVS